MKPPVKPMPSVFIKTYGCQMNERDSEAVAAQLAARGFSLAVSEKGADVVLLNTCSVRDMAEQKAIGKMHNLVAAARKQGPAALGFLGCMAQGRGAQLLEEVPGVQLVLGTQKFHHAADHLHALLSGQRKQIVDIEAEAGSEAAIREHLPRPAQVTAFVSIMQGCNQRCTFCIVPFTRGDERSRAIDDVVGECRELAARGVKEITLLGQIVTSFGRREIKPRDGKSPFVQLLEAVHEIDGLERIRFTSPHPKGYGDDLAEAYGRLPKLCESAHIPAQSGSDRLLKLMHRGYTRQRFLDIIDKLRQVRPGIGLTTDLIVGFPGETDEDFAATLSLVRAVEFDNAFIFKYSPRRDTPAAQMEGQIPAPLREARHAQLLEAVNAIGARRYEAKAGATLEVLVEGPSRHNPDRLSGRTRCNKIVVFEGEKRHQGQLLDLRIQRAGCFTLYGELPLRL
ncbi:MAG TPA: tRNA (N6-isopentenyl adenosine(37)-C2)-methylthiotransferase MiaB [Verrucomicrobiae bacterium]|jgi:tRNA-2-methylthio-N6-dimethylallyladenosine synthase|nr:tRNA (N6-isopentenyl adenosine(37)-C2)-methylthiotransferase MiaB [Verrucomicrobiae bacterium]